MACLSRPKKSTVVIIEGKDNTKISKNFTTGSYVFIFSHVVRFRFVSFAFALFFLFHDLARLDDKVLTVLRKTTPLSQLPTLQPQTNVQSKRPLSHSQSTSTACCDQQPQSCTLHPSFRCVHSFSCYYLPHTQHLHTHAITKD